MPPDTFPVQSQHGCVDVQRDGRGRGGAGAGGGGGAGGAEGFLVTHLHAMPVGCLACV